MDQNGRIELGCFDAIHIQLNIFEYYTYVIFFQSTSSCNRPVKNFL